MHLSADWSRTATQNKKRGMSVATTSTYTANATPRSASVISVLTSGSGTFPSLTCISDFIPQTFIMSRWRPADSVFMDSGISDGSNSDALLNEIHQRNPSL